MKKPSWKLTGHAGHAGTPNLRVASELSSRRHSTEVRLTHDLKIKTPSRSLLDMLMCTLPELRLMGKWSISSMDWFVGENLHRKPWFLPSNIGLSG